LNWEGYAPMPHQTTGLLLDEISKMRAVMERKEMR
jgi:hypothetical protein